MITELLTKLRKKNNETTEEIIPVVEEQTPVEEIKEEPKKERLPYIIYDDESIDEYLERMRIYEEEEEKKFKEFLEEKEREVAGKPLKSYEGVKGIGFLEHRTCIKDHCAAYDPFGLCNIMDCLKCENAYYRISLPDGSVVTNTDIQLNTLDKNGRGFEDDDHFILFYDRIPTGAELFDYLDDLNSEYRTIRLSDNMVMNDYVGEFNRVKRLEKRK